MFLIWFAFVLICIAVIYHFLTYRYLNPYKLIFLFGKKGCGKTSLLAKYAATYVAQGKKVYSTEPFPGTFSLEPEEIGVRYFPPDSVLLIDEVGLIWHCRAYKSFPAEVRKWFKLQRHHKVTVIMASQTFDIDKGLRDLCDEMYLIENKLRVWSYAKRVIRRLTVVEASGESESRITENLEIDGFLWFWCGSRKLTFIPRWAGTYDSFVVDEPLKVIPDGAPIPLDLMPYQYRKKAQKAMTLKRK